MKINAVGTWAVQDNVAFLGKLAEVRNSAAAGSMASPVAAPGVEVGRPVSMGPMEERLVALVEQALEARGAQTLELREAAARLFIEDRLTHMPALGDRLADHHAGREGLVRSLGESLAADPGFCREVDTMLLHAARRLGERG